MRAWLIVLSIDGSSAKPFFREEGGKENSVQALEQKLMLLAKYLRWKFE